MAGMVDRFRKKSKGGTPQKDWTNSGSFINKPSRGWLHPDEQLAPDVGVCYGVRYVGCMEVKQSMKSLDFETRTAVAKESISRVSEAAGLKTNAKKNKKVKVAKLLGAEPNLVFAGANINLTITTDSLSLMDMESGDMIANHQMPGVSFASGGDPDTMDFVAYVAKDAIGGRACFVLECGGGLAQDVITTIGQAFELRFKQYMNSRPEATQVRNDMYGIDAWGEDGDYYNDRPGAQPPSPKHGSSPPQYASPGCNLPVSDGIYSSVRDKAALGNLIDLGDGVYDNSAESRGNIYDNTPEQGAVGGIRNGIVYDNPMQNGSKFDNAIYDNTPKTGGASAGGAIPKDGSAQFDAFDMRPFDSALAASRAQDDDEDDIKKPNSGSPYHEEWFHGPLTRKQTEDLLQQDGDFLVRESTNSPGQYVLSGMHKGRIKHLLLVDPNGVVRTRDRTFNSVSHLINYHMENGLPIISQESELILKNPIIHATC